MPLVGVTQLTGGLQVLGDQSRILVVLLDRLGNALVQLRAIGFELRFVCDGTDEWMPECVLGLRVEGCLVDELCRDEVAEGRLDVQRRQHLWREA